MRKIIEVKPLPKKKFFIKYSNGMEGVVSLEKLAKRDEYAELRNIDIIEDYYIDEKSGDIIVHGKIVLCKNAIYGMLDLKRQMAKLGLSME